MCWVLGLDTTVNIYLPLFFFIRTLRERLRARRLRLKETLNDTQDPDSEVNNAVSYYVLNYLIRMLIYNLFAVLLMSKFSLVSPYIFFLYMYNCMISLAGFLFFSDVWPWFYWCSQWGNNFLFIKIFFYSRICVNFMVSYLPSSFVSRRILWNPKRWCEISTDEGGKLKKRYRLSLRLLFFSTDITHSRTMTGFI